MGLNEHDQVKITRLAYKIEQNSTSTLASSKADFVGLVFKQG